MIAALDAGRSEIFLGHCEVQPKLEVRTRAEVLIKPEELAERVREFCGSSGHAGREDRALGGEVNLPVTEDSRRPGRICSLRWLSRNWIAALTVRPDDLDANYLRRSDAEVFTSPPA